MVKLPQASLRLAILIVLLFVASAGLAYWLTPQMQTQQMPEDFEAMLPRKINDWTEQPNPYLQVGLVDNTDKDVDQPYDRVLMRSYRSGEGAQVMLALAYAKEQSQDVKIHRPDVCYQAQGFAINSRHVQSLNIDGQHDIQVVRLVVSQPSRLEVVSYWIRIGNEYPVTPLNMRMKILRDGLAGSVADGILVRVSSIVDDESEAAAAFVRQEEFLKEMVAALPQNQARVLARF